VLPALIIVWREALEAALVVGILLTVPARSGVAVRTSAVWVGSAAGLVAALLAALSAQPLLARLDPGLQALVLGEMLFVAAALLFWTIIWLQRWAWAVRRNLPPARLTSARLATVALVTVFQETVEMVFFTSDAAQRSDLGFLRMVAAGGVGTALAVGTAWLFFRGFASTGRTAYVHVASVLLLVVAAALLASALDQVIGRGDLPPLSVGGDEGPGGLGDYHAHLEIALSLVYLPAMLWAMTRRRIGERTAIVARFERRRGRGA
jgi:high-affinity iron transporter